MARYLSEQWFEEVNAATGQSHRPATRGDGAGLTLQQVVTGTPFGEVRYWVRVRDGSLEAGLGEAGSPDATVSQSYETAVAVVTGQLSVQAALMAGRIRLSGRMSALVEQREALEGIDAAFADVRRRTTYE